MGGAIGDEQSGMSNRGQAMSLSLREMQAMVVSGRAKSDLFGGLIWGGCLGSGEE